MKKKPKYLFAALLCLVVLFLSACGEIKVMEGKPCIYVIPDRKDVYALSYHYMRGSGMSCKANGKSLSRGIECSLIEESQFYPNGLPSRESYYLIEALGKNGEVLASQGFMYGQSDGSVTHVITPDGHISGGRPAPELVLSVSCDAGHETDSSIPVLESPADDYSCSLILSSTLPVSEIELWALAGSVSPDGSIELMEKDELGLFISTFTQLRLNASFGEFVPVNGVSFTDPFGRLRHFYFWQSAADGSINMTEYSPIDFDTEMADN